MTDFEKRIKMALLELEKNQKWFLEEVSKKTGLYFDRSYYCKIVSGKNHNPKIIKAICEILGIEEKENDGNE